MDTEKYMALFISESQEHLQSMNDSLLRIEQNPEDAEALNEAFRNAHSIKGMAASMGLAHIRDLAHAVENLMDDFRQGVRRPGAEAMDLLFQGLDRLETCVKQAAQNGEPPEARDLTDRIQSLRQAPAAAEAGKEATDLPGVDLAKYQAMFISESRRHLEQLAGRLEALKKNPADREALAEAFLNAHSIQGMAATIRRLEIQNLAHALENLLDEFKEKKLAPGQEALEIIEAGARGLNQTIQELEEGRASSPEAAALTDKLRNFLKTRAEAPAPEKAGAESAAAPPDQGPAEKKIGIELDFDEPPPKPRSRPAAAVEVDFDAPLPRAGPRAESERGPAPQKPPPPAEPPPMAASGQQQSGPAAEASSDLEEIDQPPPSPESPPAVPAPPPPAPPAAPSTASHLVRVVFSADAVAPGVRGLILFKRLSEVGRILGSRPDMAEVKSGNFLKHGDGLAVEIDLFSEVPDSEIIKAINSLSDVKSFELKKAVSPPPPSSVPAEPVPPPPSELESSAGVVTDQGRVEPVFDPFAQVQGLPQTVRVKTTALDRFIGALGEMIMVKSELREAAKHSPLPGLEQGLDRLESLIKDFHDQVMSIRMMPLDSVVQRLPRVVRDLAREEGKRVKFEVKGRDIELDRAILEQLTDPLVHLLRNSVSHGIERPEEREKLKKPAEGRIEIEAYRQRDLVLIEVRDDGRGMDPFLLKEAAVAKGLISAEEADQMADEDAINLIFNPGFSTAKQVGMISGRGVGMDAVKNTAESVGGYVTVSTATGRGTAFTLHLPRTIAIVNVLLVRVASEVFGLPIAKVLKTVEILPHQLRKSQNKQFYLDRQELVPIKALHRFLDLPEPADGARGPLPALIIESRKRKLALTVDELLGQEEAFIRPLGKPLEKISGLSGVTMLGDGRVVFVLDTMTLI